jgi:hypothetical protein
MSSSSASSTSSSASSHPPVVSPPSSISARSCIHSKWGHLALLVFSVACLAIAVLATGGAFCGIGVAAATTLSYVMYGMAGFFFLVLLVKVALTSCVKERTEA